LAVISRTSRLSRALSSCEGEAALADEDKADGLTELIEAAGVVILAVGRSLTF
jgi:hypothetical protein